MSASDTRRQSRSIVIRRDDHIGDPIGLVFLDSPETDGDALLERLREYLGRRLKLIKAEVSRSEITVEIESRGWREEGARLAAAARDLYNKGARRNAQSMYREALELDPINADAILGIGLALTDQGKYSEALATLNRLARTVPNPTEALAPGAAAMVKIVYCISKLPHLSNDEFHRYWRDVHGPIAGRIRGCRKYVQSHTIYRAIAGREPSFDGVAELWFDDWQALETAMASKEVKAAIEDERKFIDHSRTAFFIAEEHQVI